MPKHIHVLRENAYNIPIGTAMVTNTEANAMLAEGDAIEIQETPLPQTQEAPPTIIVQQSEPKPKTTTIKRNRKQGPMKTKFSNSKIKKS